MGSGTSGGWGSVGGLGVGFLTLEPILTSSAPFVPPFVAPPQGWLLAKLRVLLRNKGPRPSASPAFPVCPQLSLLLCDRLGGDFTFLSPPHPTIHYLVSLSSLQDTPYFSSWGSPRPVVPSDDVTGEKMGGGWLRRVSSHLGPPTVIDPANHLHEKKPWAPARPASSAQPPLPRVVSSLCRPPHPRPASNSADTAHAAAPACRERGQGRKDWSGMGFPQHR